MPRIAGLKMQTTTTGRITSVTVNMKRWGHLMEDILDAMGVERSRLETTTPWEPLKKKLDKKHGIKR